MLGVYVSELCPKTNERKNTNSVEREKKDFLSDTKIFNEYFGDNVKGFRHPGSSFRENYLGVSRLSFRVQKL